jgi:hypothetical protein
MVLIGLLATSHAWEALQHRPDDDALYGTGIAVVVELFLLYPLSLSAAILSFLGVQFPALVYRRVPDSRFVDPGEPSP